MTDSFEPSVMQAGKELAERVALSVADRREQIGEYVGANTSEDGLTEFLFNSDITGYENWKWSVSLFYDKELQNWTVCESSLIPSKGALLAPEWVSWKDRLLPSDLSPSDVLGTDPDDERLEPVYRLAAEFDLPVVSHTGGCEQAMSPHLYNAAKRHPELKFVMVHMDLGTDNSVALDLLGKLPNLYGDTTWVPMSTTIDAIQRYGSEKMLFGTDNPIDGKDTLLHNKTGVRSLYQQYFNELKALLPAGDYDNLMYKNAQRMFGL